MHNNEAFRGIREFRERSSMKFPYSIRKERSERFAEFASSYSRAREMSPEEFRIHELTNLRLPRLLKWEDRNSMAFSIESRVPFLDVNLVEFLLSIPCEMNMSGGWTKRLFRKAMSDKLPRSICWRKRLLDWAADSAHPVSEYITTPFEEIGETLRSGDYDTTSMFRLFCLDEWLRGTGSSG